MPDAPRPSRAELRARQFHSLRELLTAIADGNAFYRRRLEPLGAEFFRIESIEDFSRRFPFTTKSEVAADQLANPPYGTNLTYPLAQYTRCHQTSGTTGTPLRWLDTPADWDGLTASWLQVLRAAEVKPADRVFFAFSFGPFIGFWMAFAAAERLGCLCIPGGGLSTSARLRSILDHRATVLCCTPTYALHLAETAAREGIDLHRSAVRCLLVAGEPGGSVPATRARLQQAWPGARVCDHHGMTEVGPVTYECPAEPGVLHVMEHAYLAEVIDPASSRAVADGRRGELVLTTLGRIGMPLLRYRTGDLVQPRFAPGRFGVPPCACGRHELALTGGILGRVDDMVIVRGVNVFPSAVDDVIRRFAEVVEYQVLLTRPGGLVEMGIEIEPTADCPEPAALARSVQEEFHIAFALRVPVTFVPPGTLPRYELKARRWVRLNQPQAA